MEDGRATDTNLLIGMLANTDKLVSTEKRIEMDNRSTEPPKEDDDLDKYKQTDHEKYDDIPEEPKHDDKLSDKDYRLRQLDMLRKLGELAQSGVTLSQDYDINSDYDMMKAEYELHMGIRSKRNAINWMSSVMLTFVKGLELLNDNYNPFDIMRFDGSWTTDVQKNITAYYDVLGEIYEKYSSPDKKMMPELKLIFLLTGGAFNIQLAKSVTTMLPKLSKDIDEKPDILKKLREKAEKEREEREKSIKELYAKENDQVRKKMEDLKTIEINRRMYEDMQKQALNKKKMEAMKSGLILSDTSKKVSRDEVISEQKSLREINKRLSNMKKEVEDDIKSSNSSKLSSISINPKIDDLTKEKKSVISKGKKSLEITF